MRRRERKRREERERRRRRENRWRRRMVPRVRDGREGKNSQASSAVWQSKCVLTIWPKHNDAVILHHHNNTTGH